MSLVKCPECGREISDEAKTCPGCGYGIFSHSIQEKNKIKDEITIKQEKALGRIPKLMGILFLIPPIIYFLNKVILTRMVEMFYYYHGQHLDLFMRGIAVDIIRSAGVCIIFLLISIGWFVICKTRIPSFIGLCVLSITMLGASLADIGNVVQAYRFLINMGASLELRNFIQCLAELFFYFVMFIAILMFAIVVITAFDIKVLDVVANFMIIASFVIWEITKIASATFYRLPITDVVNWVFSDLYYLSVLISFIIAFLVMKKKIRYAISEIKK